MEEQEERPGRPENLKTAPAIDLLPLRGPPGLPSGSSLGFLELPQKAWGLVFCVCTPFTTGMTLDYFLWMAAQDLQGQLLR